MTDMGIYSPTRLIQGETDSTHKILIWIDDISKGINLWHSSVEAFRDPKNAEA
jgi:hypothetical protein